MNITNQINNTQICTLGPTGTDSSVIANRLSKNVMLMDSFPNAMDYAFKHNVLALVPCGYQKIVNEKLVDSWVNLNFRYNHKMKIKHIFLSKTKPMCLAINQDVKLKRNACILHPATMEFANIYCPQLEKIFIDSKPLAVSQCASGKYSHCIGSVDVVKLYPNMKILNTFTPQMVWALHYKSTKT